MASQPEHHRVVIAGGGISGLTALLQLNRKLGIKDVKVYEKGKQLGGTWASNSYPGASSDIPISLYSLSFSPAKEFDSQWPASTQILSYWRRIVDKYQVSDSITYRTLITHAKFSRSTNLWTLELRDLESNETRIETCNVFISAVGALSTPSDPPFDTTRFEGKVVHTGQWDNSLTLEGKNLVVLGNGCSASQFVPAVIDQVESLTQIARSKHSIVPPVQVPDNWLTNFLVRWIPGLFTLMRCGVFFLCESYFWMNQDTDKAKRGRHGMKKLSDRYIEKTAPRKYWDNLKYEFEFGQKRRVIDFQGYTTALHSPKMTLLQPDTISTAVGKTITTSNGETIEDVDIVVLSTGFKVTDYLFPLVIENDRGEKLVERLKANGVKTYLTSMVAEYPNFFMLMGPNSVTGHSSVLFNTECTVDMMINLLRPVFASMAKNPSPAALAIATPIYNTEERVREAQPFSTSPLDEKFDFNRTPPPLSPMSPTFAPPPPAILPSIVLPGPTVEVTLAAEDEWYAALREEMSKKIWERSKVSWYTDPEQGGKCTTLYPWSQIHFKKSTQNIVKDRFIWTNCD